jgi:hypothetical protein
MKVAAALAAIAMSTSSHAMLVDHGATTLDTSTGLEWLDLTQSLGLSFSDVVRLQSDGGRLSGWQFATIAEVQAVVAQTGLPLAAAAHVGQLDVSAFGSLFGLTATGGFQGIVGGSTIPDAPDYHPVFWAYVSGGVNTALATGDPEAGADSWVGRYVYNECFTGVADDVTDRETASFLVREAIAPVPEPSTWATMLAGLLAAGAGLRRATGGRRTAA